MAEVGKLNVSMSLDDANFQRSLASMNRSLLALGQEIKGLQNKGKDWGNSLEGLRKKQDAYSRLLDQQKERISKLSDEYERVKAEQGEHGVETERLEVRLARANAEMIRTERELSEITAELKKQEAELAQSQTSWDKFRETVQEASEKLKSVGEKMTTIGKNLTTKVTTPLAALGAGIVKVGMDFDSQMSKVAAVSGATGQEFDSLREKAKELGATTKFTSSQVAEGMEYLALAGYNTNQILASTDGLLNLAAAASMDLGRAADIVTDIMSAFGIEASKAGHAADVFAFAQANANTNVEQIGEAMKYAAPLANQMGWTIEQTAAAMMKLADNGLKGSIAGQAFASSVGRLSKPTTEMRKKMNELGISFFDANENMKSLPDIIAELEKGTKGLSMKQKSAAITTLFGAEAYKHWAILLESGSETLATYTKELENSDGTAQNMADTMVDNLGGSLLMLKSAVEGLMIQFSDLIKGDIRAFADWLTELAGKFSKLDDNVKKVILVVGGLVAAIGPVLIVLGLLISSVGTVMGALAGLSLPIVAIVAGIGLLVAALVGAYTQFDGFKEKVDSVFNAVKEITTNVLTTIVDFIHEVLSDLANFWSENGEQILLAATNIFNGIRSVVEFVMPAIQFIIDMVWTAIKQIVTGALDVIMGAVKVFSGLFTGDFSKMWEGVKQLFIGAIDVIIGWMSLTFFGGIRTLFMNLGKSAINLVKGMWDDVLKLFTNSIKTGETSISEFVKNLLKFFKNLATDLVNTFSNMKTNVANKVGEIKDSIVNTLKNIDLKQIGKDIIQGLIDGIGSMASAVWDKVKEIAGGITDAISGALGFKSKSSSRTSMRMGGYANQLRSAMDNAYDGMNRLNTSYNSSRTYDYSRKMTNQITINASKNESRDLERLFRRLAFEF